MTNSSESLPCKDFEKERSPLHVEFAEGEKHLATEIVDAHREFLIARHGTADLAPLPLFSVRDPLNWSRWKKLYHLLMIALQTFTCSFMSAGISPAYLSMAVDYGKSATECSYLTTAQIALLGIAPMFWTPLMEIYGRKPILVISSFCSMVANIGGVYCTTYGQQMATRVISALFISSGMSLGGAFTGAMCFEHERARKNGVWLLATILGTPSGPILMGFVIQHVGLKWVFWTYTVLNFFQTFGWMISDETKYIAARDGETTERSFFKRYVGFGKFEDRKLSFRDVFRPFQHAKNPKILISSVAAMFVFAFGNIVFIVETPLIFSQLFDFDSQQLALQYIPMVIGYVIGEFFGGKCSDLWVSRRLSVRGYRHPADRLTFIYGAYVLTIGGLMIWGAFLYTSKAGHWTVKPLIGMGICAAGADILCTVLMTYAIDCHPSDATNVSLFVMFLRLVFGFISPFYFPNMFSSLNYAGSAGLMSGILLVTFIVVAGLQWKESRKPHTAVV